MTRGWKSKWRPGTAAERSGDDDRSPGRAAPHERPSGPSLADRRDADRQRSIQLLVSPPAIATWCCSASRISPSQGNRQLQSAPPRQDEGDDRATGRQAIAARSLGLTAAPTADPSRVSLGE